MISLKALVNLELFSKPSKLIITHALLYLITAMQQETALNMNPIDSKCGRLRNNL